jgi:ATP-binding cassette subfamily B protein
MKALLQLFHAHKRSLLLGLGSILLANAFALAIPWVLKEAVDHIGGAPHPTTLVFFALLIVGLTMIQGLFRFVARRKLIGTSRELEYDLRNTLFWQLLHLPPSFYDRSPIGDLMTRSTQDMTVLRTLLGAGPLHLTNTLIVYVSTITLMVLIDPWLTLYALSPFPLLLLTLTRLRVLIQDRFRTVQEAYASVCGHVQETVAGMRLVKAYTMEHPTLKEFARRNQEYMQRELAVVRWEGISHPLTGIVGGIGMVLTLAIGGQKVIAGEMTLGALVAFNGYLAMLMWPTMAFAWIANLLQRGLVAFERIQEVLAETPAIREHPHPIHLPTVTGQIEARRLSFAYGNGSSRPALHEVSFTIPAGTVVAVVGPIGAGKSTLLSLLPRLREVPEGHLFLDGVDVTHLTLTELRGRIGYVPQEAFLFSDTLCANITFGRPDAPDALLRRAIHLAGFEEDLETFPQGLETVVGERGVTLSGGQRQRVTIARALAIDPQILILDDALSSVDAERERQILHRIVTALTGRTILVSTHRLSSIREADLILVLEGGGLVEQGRHEQLLRQGGCYARLWRRYQLLEELK